MIAREQSAKFGLASVMGYHRPICQWNKGKQQEHYDRKHFNEPTESDIRVGQEVKA